MRGRLAGMGIAFGIVLAASPVRPAVAGGGGCRETQSTSERTTVVIMSQACFLPTLARVPVGSVVTWTNKDPMTHTVSGANGVWGNFDELRVDDTTTARFDRPGAYPYYCAFHPGMVAAILVGDANGPGPATNNLSAATARTRAVVTGAVDEASVKLAAKDEDRSGPAWPVVAIGIAVVSAGAGFGFGRRFRQVRV